MDVSELNRQLEAVRLPELDALAGPVEVAARLSRERQAAWHSVAAVLLPSKNDYEVTIVLDQVGDDDSVSGYRYTFVMTRPHPGTWSVTSAKQSWRCWPGRGHRDFSVEPCS
jgi:hypothetical protein